MHARITGIPGLAAILLAAAGVSAAAQSAPTTPYPVMAPVEQYLIPGRDAEIALARTAAPPSISADAEILILGRHGYEAAVPGKNGFVCFVERSWAAGLLDRQFWNPAIRGPNCFNPPAARTELIQVLARTQWAMAGATHQQIVDRTKLAWKRHRFKSPAPEAFSFMLSKQGNLGDAAGGGPWLPHVMFFIPHGHSANWGAGKAGSPAIAAEAGTLESTLIFVPVRAWSDGSLAPLVQTPHQM